MQLLALHIAKALNYFKNSFHITVFYNFNCEKAQIMFDTLFIY